MLRMNIYKKKHMLKICLPQWWKLFYRKCSSIHIKFEREGGIRGEKGGRGVVGREVEIKYKLDRVGPNDNRPTTD